MLNVIIIATTIVGCNKKTFRRLPPRKRENNKKRKRNLLDLFLNICTRSIVRISFFFVVVVVFKFLNKKKNSVTEFSFSYNTLK